MNTCGVVLIFRYRFCYSIFLWPEYLLFNCLVLDSKEKYYAAYQSAQYFKIADTFSYILVYNCTFAQN